MIRLYHGSNIAIEQIDLSCSKRGKDFGQGFYLNANPDQAMEMAVRTTRFLNEGTATLSCLEFDEDEAKRELRFKSDHAVQYFFGTPKAIQLLKRIEL